jgi:hypothetical protein
MARARRPLHRRDLRNEKEEIPWELSGYKPIQII